MIADDPFTHEEFRDRLGKLMRLLSSDQQAEAEAARQKLLRHLAQHGVSLNDVSAHLVTPLAASLGDVHGVAPDTVRTLALRAQRAEIAHRAAEQMNERLLGMLERLRRQLLTVWILAGTLAVAIVLTAAVVFGTAWLRHREEATTVQQIAPRMSDAVKGANQPAASSESDPGLRQPGEWIGTLTQPAELLDAPDSAAQRRAMLDSNGRVLVLGAGPVWLHVRTEHGDGYLLKGLVRAEPTSH